MKEEFKNQLHFNLTNKKELANIKNEDKLNYQVRSIDNTSNVLFENKIDLISVEELAVIFRLAPQTIRNWIALGKIPHIKIGRRHFFKKRSLQEWINRKEKPQWR